MVPVTSSNLKAVGYDALTNTLAVQFSSGATYHYSGVDSDAHDALMKSESKGSHFFKNIKGKFDYQRQEERK
jgi:hypothetical protein